MHDIARRHFTIVAIIAFCAAVFLGQQLKHDEIVDGFAAVPQQISGAWAKVTAGQFDSSILRPIATLLTCVFLHGDVEHILFNMVFLWAFGTLASEHLGAWWALLVFVVTGVCGTLAQVLLNPASPIPIIGASGAVCGFEGLYLGLALRWEMNWPDVWPLAEPVPPQRLAVFAAVGFAFDAYSLMEHQRGVAYGAHMGGLIAGVAIAALITSLYPTEGAFQRSGWGRKKS